MLTQKVFSTFEKENITLDKIFKEITVLRTLVIFSIFLVLLIAFELSYFVTGFLGAVTLYVVSRNFYHRLVEKYRWNKNLATFFIILSVIICFGIPVWVVLEILIPQINTALQDPQKIIERFQPIVLYLQNHEVVQRLDIEFTSHDLMNMVNRIISYIPSTLNWVGQFFANILVALFILYFMLMSSRSMEQGLKEMLPFSEKSKRYFIKENLDLIRSNAYGVPVMAVSQGFIAVVGYSIFGVEQAVFWGLMTGLASVVPVVGTMVIWVPVCIYQMASGDVNSGLWLSLYCVVLVGGIDNVLRFTLLKKMADIHPLITVFGVILGLQLFGAMGLIFGPLLLSFPRILYAVYKIEKRRYFPFVEEDAAETSDFQDGK